MAQPDMIFRPHTEPAITLYDAVCREMRKRNTNHDWVLRERSAMYAAAFDYATKHGLKVLCMDQIMQAESQSLGSTDYASKWAIKVANMMTRSGAT